MADSNANSYTVDLQKLIKKVEELRKTEEQLNEQQQQLNESFKQGKVSARQYEQQTRSLDNQLKSNKNQLNQLKNSLGKKGISGNLDGLLSQSKGLTGSFGKLGSSLSNLSGGFTKLIGAAKGMAGPWGLALTLAKKFTSLFFDFDKIGKWFNDFREASDRTFHSWKVAWFDLTGQTERLNKELGNTPKSLEEINKEIKENRDLTEQSLSKFAEYADAMKDEANNYIATGNLENYEKAVSRNNLVWKTQAAVINLKKEEIEIEDKKTNATGAQHDLNVAMLNLYDQQQEVLLQQENDYQFILQNQRAIYALAQSLIPLKKEEVKLQNELAALNTDLSVLDAVAYKKRLDLTTKIANKQKEINNKQIESNNKQIETYKTIISREGTMALSAEQRLQYQQKIADLENSNSTLSQKNADIDKKNAADLKKLKEEYYSYLKQEENELFTLQTELIDDKYDREEQKLVQQSRLAIDKWKEVYASAKKNGESYIAELSQKIIRSLEEVENHNFDVLNINMMSDNLGKVGIQFSKVLQKAFHDAWLVEAGESFNVANEELNNAQSALWQFEDEFGDVSDALRTEEKDVYDDLADNLKSAGDAYERESMKFFKPLVSNEDEIERFATMAAGSLKQQYDTVVKTYDKADELLHKYGELVESEEAENFHIDTFSEMTKTLFDEVDKLYKVVPQLDQNLAMQAANAGVTSLSQKLKNLKDAEEAYKKSLEGEEKELNKLNAAEMERYQQEIHAIAVAAKSRIDYAKAALDEENNSYNEQIKLIKDKAQSNTITKEQENQQIQNLEAEHNTKMLELEQVYQDRKKQIIDETNASVEKAYETHVQSLDNIDTNLKNQQILKEQSFKEQKKAIDLEMYNNTIQFFQGMSSAVSALAQVYDAEANDTSKSESQRQKAQRKSLNLQIASVFVAMAASLAQGISNAVSAGWPAMLATIPATVAELIAEFAQVKSVLAKKNSGSYATGGLIGNETTNDKSDSINANVSRGEYITNSEATARNLPLLDTINYSGNRNNVLGEIVGAIANMSPVVSVQQIEHVTDQKNQTDVYGHL